MAKAPILNFPLKTYNIFSSNFQGTRNSLLFLNELSFHFYLIALYFIGRFKLLTSIRIASSLVLVGSLIRALSTMPIQAYDDAVPRKVQFWITFVGQVRDLTYTNCENVFVAKNNLPVKPGCFSGESGLDL
jgi:hypothetical protein